MWKRHPCHVQANEQEELQGPKEPKTVSIRGLHMGRGGGGKVGMLAAVWGGIDVRVLAALIHFRVQGGDPTSARVPLVPGGGTGS